MIAACTFRGLVIVEEKERPMDQGLMDTLQLAKNALEDGRTKEAMEHIEDAMEMVRDDSSDY